MLPGRDGDGGLRRGRARRCCPAGTSLALEDVELLAPFKFYRDEPRTLELRALLRDGGDGTVVADCRLIGRRTLPGQDEQETVHFTGRARLAQAPPTAPPDRERPSSAARERGEVDRDAVYRVYFHGPAYQVLDRAWQANGDVVGRLARDLPPAHEPPGQPTEIAPRLIELCFQTAGVWELGTSGRMALPTARGRVRPLRRRRRAGTRCSPSSATVTATASTPRWSTSPGRVRVRLEGYRTIELPGRSRSRRARPDPRGDGLGRARRPWPRTNPSPDSRSSTAARRRCGSSTPSASSTTSAASSST